jgi:hypothetical protein
MRMIPEHGEHQREGDEERRPARQSLPLEPRDGRIEAEREEQRRADVERIVDSDCTLVISRMPTPTPRVATSAVRNGGEASRDAGYCENHLTDGG